MDDETGFFMLTLLYYLLWTCSAFVYALLIHAALNEGNEVGGSQCGYLESRLLFGGMVLAFLAIATGCFWCGQPIWNSVVDDSSAQSIWVTVLVSSQLLWHAFYCVFLITACYVWKTLAKQCEITVGGLPYSYAATGIVVSQVVILVIVVFYSLDFASTKENLGTKTMQSTYTTIFFNYAILMTGYFIHTFFLSLFAVIIDDVKDEGSTDDDTYDGIPSDTCDREEVSEKRDDYVENAETYSQYDIVVNEDKNLRTSDSAEELPSGMTSGRLLTYFVGAIVGEQC